MRKLILCQRTLFNLDAVSGIQWRHVASVFYHDRINKMLVQMVHVLSDATFERRTHRDVVEERKVLYVFAQPDTAGMRTNRHAEFFGHEDDRQDLVHSAQTTTVDLAEANRLRL